MPHAIPHFLSFRTPLRALQPWVQRVFAPTDKKLRSWAVLASILLVLGYITYHLFNGDRGLFAFTQLSEKRIAVQTALDNVRAERLNLEHKVQLLRPESLDIDLLDEQARALLGFAENNERVVLQ